MNVTVAQAHGEELLEIGHLFYNGNEVSIIAIVISLSADSLSVYEVTNVDEWGRGDYVMGDTPLEYQPDAEKLAACIARLKAKIQTLKAQLGEESNDDTMGE